MPNPTPPEPDFGSWVPSSLVHGPAAVAVLRGALSALSSWFIPPAFLFLACTVYFAYARRKLSHRVGVMPWWRICRPPSLRNAIGGGFSSVLCNGRMPMWSVCWRSMDFTCSARPTGFTRTLAAASESSYAD